MARLKFYYLCKARNPRRRYAKWHKEDWSRSFCEEQQIGQVVHFNDRFDLIPQKLEVIYECGSDFFSDLMIYHPAWFSLPFLARTPMDPSLDDDFDLFLYAVGRLSAFGFNELVMDMMHQAHIAGYDAQPAKVLLL